MTSFTTSIDMNADGVTDLTILHDEVDTDGDGVVTAEDMDAAHEKHGAEGKCGEGKCGGSV